MFQCAWCKKEDSASEWSKEREPLCSECAHKYNFGVKQGMITGNVSDLSKEQRRRVSERMNNFERFWGALRSVEKEELEGKLKILSGLIGCLLFVFSFALFYWLVAIVERHITGTGTFWLIVFYLALIPYGIQIYLIYEKIFWILQYCQLKKKVKENGYGGI